VKSGSVTVKFYLRAYVNFYPSFPYFLTDLGQIRYREIFFYVIPWGNCTFSKKRCCESHNSLKPQIKIFPYTIYAFSQILTKLGTRNIHKDFTEHKLAS
jgi:hypothetical protein